MASPCAAAASSSSYTASSSYIEFDRCRLIPLSAPSLCTCHLTTRRHSSFLIFGKKHILSRPDSSRLRSRLFLDVPKGRLTISRGPIVNPGKLITAVENIHDEGQTNEEVNEGNNLLPEQSSDLKHQQKTNQLKKRIVFGLGIGTAAGGIVLAGGWVFTAALAAAVFVGAREYFELVRSHGIAAGMTPPPRYVSRVCSVICALMPIITLYVGHIDVSVTSAAFVVAMALLLQRGIPRFSQLSSTMFGLFYCGYLPCFWVKLRCGLAAPSLNTSKNLFNNMKLVSGVASLVFSELRTNDLDERIKESDLTVIC